MSTFPRTPQILKAGLVLLDASSLAQKRIIVLQYNPDHLTRTLQIQGMSGESGDRSEALRLKGPPVETYKLEAEIDATDQISGPDPDKTALAVGIFPQLAALESLVTPHSDQLTGNDLLLRSGAIEIAPMEAPLTLFVWSVQRVVPVRVSELSITEEAFDVHLNPIRAKVSLSLRVLSVNDLGFDHPGSNLFMSYLQNKEALVKRAAGGSFTDLGFKPLP